MPVDHTSSRPKLPLMPTVLELELIRLRCMTAAEKIAVSEALWREAWALKRSAIATQHPDWSAAQLERATREAMASGGP